MSNVTTHPTWIQSFALKILGIIESFWAAYSPSLATETQILLSQLAPIAISVVAAQAAVGNSGNAALLAATEQAKTLAIQAGIQASTTAIQTAIQLAKIHLDAASKSVSSAPVVPASTVAAVAANT